MGGNKKAIINSIKNTNWRSVPLELYVFMAFGVFIPIADFIIHFIGPEEMHKALLPFTGWSISNGINFMTTFFAIALCITRNIKIRNVLLILLGINITFGLIEFLIPWGDDFGNPYLIRSYWRPVWTMMIPAIWIIVLLSPRIKRYCQSNISI
jgi:hypothetical protein